MYKTREHAAVGLIGRARKFLRVDRHGLDPADIEFELKFYHCQGSNVCRLILRDVGCRDPEPLGRDIREGRHEVTGRDLVTDLTKASDGTRFPRLIQRVDLRKPPLPNSRSKGVDRWFTFDMGSSEFEFGALPAALREMRAAKKKDQVGQNAWQPEKIQVGDHVVYFVGDSKLITCATELFEDQLHDLDGRKIWTKERSNIFDTFYPDKDGYFKHDGWWALDAKPPWILFKTLELAHQWRECLDNK